VVDTEKWTRYIPPVTTTMQEPVQQNLEFAESHTQQQQPQAILEFPPHQQQQQMETDYRSKSLPPIMAMHANHVNNQPVDGEWVGGIYVTSSRPGLCSLMILLCLYLFIYFIFLFIYFSFIVPRLVMSLYFSDV
jgi:hypothetical protein